MQSLFLFPNHVVYMLFGLWLLRFSFFLQDLLLLILDRSLTSVPLRPIRSQNKFFLHCGHHQLTLIDIPCSEFVVLLWSSFSSSESFRFYCRRFFDDVNCSSNMSFDIVSKRNCRCIWSINWTNHFQNFGDFGSRIVYNYLAIL